MVSSPHGASCGLEVAEGARVGLFLTLTDDGIWTSGLCSQIEPEVLLRAAAPLPEPNGVGPIWLIIGVAILVAIAVAFTRRSRAS